MAISFEDRECIQEAWVPDQEILFCALTMQDLNVVLSPTHQANEVNSTTPIMPSSFVKSASRPFFVPSW